MRNVRRVHVTDIWSWYRVELRVGDHLGRSEELVSRCVECDLAEPESLVSLGGSAPGVVDGILSILTSPSIFADVGTKITVMENILHAFSLDKTEPEFSFVCHKLGNLGLSGNFWGILYNYCYILCEKISSSTPTCL